MVEIQKLVKPKLWKPAGGIKVYICCMYVCIFLTLGPAGPSEPGKPRPPGAPCKDNQTCPA